MHATTLQVMNSSMHADLSQDGQLTYTVLKMMSYISHVYLWSPYV